MELQLSSDRQISYLRDRYDIKEQPENTLTFAFGDRRFQKLTEQIQTGEDILKQKCLIEINQDFHKADNITQALLSSHILKVIIQNITHSDNQIRQLTSKSLIQICSVKQGRDEIIENNMILNIVKLIDDNEIKIRENCYKSLIQFSETLQAKNDLLEKKILLSLVDKLIEEKEEQIMILNLKLINKIIYGKGGVCQILETQGIKRLINIVSRSNKIIVSLALDCLSSISFNIEGKQKILEQEGVLIICNGLYDQNIDIVINSSKALASMAQLIEAKKIILSNNHFSHIVNLLANNHHFQLITSLAEDPLGRQLSIKQALSLLKSQIIHQNNQEYAQQAIEVITWIP